MKRIFLATLALTLLVGCSGIRVSQDYDPATSFDSLRSYRWQSDAQTPSGDPRIDNPLLDKRIRMAIDRVLTGQGITRFTTGAALFGVRYQYTLRRRIESNGSRIGFGVGSYGRRGGIAIGTSSGDTLGEYDEGALVIDFLAPESGELLWRGSGIHRYREYDDPAAATAAMDALVEQILEQFPPQ